MVLRCTVYERWSADTRVDGSYNNNLQSNSRFRMDGCGWRHALRTVDQPRGSHQPHHSRNGRNDKLIRVNNNAGAWYLPNLGEGTQRIRSTKRVELRGSNYDYIVANSVSRRSHQASGRHTGHGRSRVRCGHSLTTCPVVSISRPVERVRS